MATQGTTGKPAKRGALGHVVRAALAALPAVTTTAGILLSSSHQPRPVRPAPPPIVAQAGQTGAGLSAGVPVPLLAKGHPVQWFFVFKLNGTAFPKCGDDVDARTCAFDSKLKPADYSQGFGQRYVVASNEAPTLVDGGPQCLGDSTSDPVGATFDEVYNGRFHYLLWNDQFEDTAPNPASTVLGCSKGDCNAPWGHSKGMLAWNDAGEGMVMQVSTPGWPGSGNPKFQRSHGNSLGCIVDDDDVGVSQHFFALRLTKDDVVKVLKGMEDASVATDPTNPQVSGPQPVGGPVEVVTEVKKLGKKTNDPLDPTMPWTLSSGVQFIAKPSSLHAPPWQVVSALLGGVPLRTATWWVNQPGQAMPSTTASTPIPCLDPKQVHGRAGAVEIALTGTWAGRTFRLTSNAGTSGNHAKIGVSTTATDHYAIFGDENQQGVIAPIPPSDADKNGTGCDGSQGGRGGMFFAMQNAALSTSIAGLIKGDSVPVAGK